MGFPMVFLLIYLSVRPRSYFFSSFCTYSMPKNFVEFPFNILLSELSLKLKDVNFYFLRMMVFRIQEKLQHLILMVVLRRHL